MISAVKQRKALENNQSKKLNFFEFPRVSPGGQPLAKEREDSEPLVTAASAWLYNFEVNLNQYKVFLSPVSSCVCGCNPKVLPFKGGKLLNSTFL